MAETIDIERFRLRPGDLTKMNGKRPTVPASRPSTRTTMDTILISQAVIDSWRIPPFQRPLKVNAKVREVQVLIAQNGGVIPGVIVLGRLAGDLYRLDGQHRIASFLMTGLHEGIADVRIVDFDTMAEMGDEFVRLNQKIVAFKPDDVLRGIEGSCEALMHIRKVCPFVGYDNIRRGSTSPLLSMSAMLRCWGASEAESPSTCGMSGVQRANTMSPQSARECCEFLLMAERAWGRDRQYARLWGNLNLTLCMWLFRRTVLSPPTQKTKRVKAIDRDLFLKCLMSLSASSDYIDWLRGRLMNERDRSPSYSRIKQLFARRMEQETGTRACLPAPAWSSYGGGVAGAV